MLKVLAIVFTLAFASAVASADSVTFDFETAVYGPGSVSVSNGFVTLTFTRTGGLEVTDLSPFQPFGVPFGWGTHSLSTFLDPVSDTFLMVTISTAAGYFVESIGWEMGDEPFSDGDVLTVSSLADGFPLARVLGMDTTSFLHDVTLLGGSPFVQRAFPMTALNIKAGSPGSPNSVYLDNFEVTYWNNELLFAGTDIPESGFGGNPAAGAGTSGAFSVPEPRGLLLAMTAIGLALLRVRRRKALQAG